MSTKKSLPIVIAAVVAGIGIAWVAGRRGPDLPALPVWQYVLKKHHGNLQALRLAEQIRKRYHELLVEHPLPENPVLRRHATQNILPGLALYQVLLKEYGGDQQAALAEVDEALRAWTLKRNRFMLAPLKFIPEPFGLFKMGFGLQMRSFPAEGWDFEYIERSDERIAFNATRCFYLDTLRTYGAPELTASFCKSDDVMAELLPSSIIFVRPHTLGRGDALCDFQYCRVR